MKSLISWGIILVGKWNAGSQARQTQVPHSGDLVLSTGNSQNQCRQEVSKKQCAGPEKLRVCWDRARGSTLQWRQERWRSLQQDTGGIRNTEENPKIEGSAKPWQESVSRKKLSLCQLFLGHRTKWLKSIPRHSKIRGHWCLGKNKFKGTSKHDYFKNFSHERENRKGD